MGTTRHPVALNCDFSFVVSRDVGDLSKAVLDTLILPINFALQSGHVGKRGVPEDRTMQKPFKPSKEQLENAAGKKVPDLIEHGLKVLFCGINPGLYSGAVGHHFARPGNRFWPTLFAAGFTDRLISPFEEDELLLRGYGITNLVRRATASADELVKEEITQGALSLKRRVLKYRPRFVAVLGISAYRTAFQRPGATIGLQQDDLIRDSRLWVLPNPSGLNAHYQRADLARLFRELRDAAG
jgi:TDG/mug DNA glycosylase family protein